MINRDRYFDFSWVSGRRQHLFERVMMVRPSVVVRCSWGLMVVIHQSINVMSIHDSSPIKGGGTPTQMRRSLAPSPKLRLESKLLIVTSDASPK